MRIFAKYELWRWPTHLKNSQWNKVYWAQPPPPPPNKSGLSVSHHHCNIYSLHWFSLQQRGNPLSHRISSILYFFLLYMLKGSKLEARLNLTQYSSSLPLVQWQCCQAWTKICVTLQTHTDCSLSFLLFHLCFVKSLQRESSPVVFCFIQITPCLHTALELHHNKQAACSLHAVLHKANWKSQSYALVLPEIKHSPRANVSNKSRDPSSCVNCSVSDICLQ